MRDRIGQAIIADLLEAEVFIVRAEVGEAKKCLRRALGQAHDYTFTPRALEVLVVAAGMDLSSTDRRVLELVAFQPAATYETRLRAIGLLGGAPHRAPALSAEQVYEMVRRLGDRLESGVSAA